MIMGVDEAGRGPVIGPMVVCGAAISEDDLHEIESMGLKDSKKLTPKKREEFSIRLKDVCKFELLVVEPSQIDLRIPNEESLNMLEVECFSKVILKSRPDIVYIDSCDVNPGRFGLNVKKLLDFEAEIISAHQADSKYPIVSAASIIAKVHRDSLVRKISESIGEDVGSGYPGDEVTIEFLKRYYMKNKKMPEFVRKSWKTTANIINELSQARLTEYF
ncbi:ribonuclease HII [Methanocella sp. CWC-04]|uniref:Ribonuclease HII n=1 Tax=Methanooceanicella nereidis TaxID=2052831 RepID=A0AAP2RDS3_9EURY|nr:ribonuclease HII [Methanocella sp. CWC-04]